MSLHDFQDEPSAHLAVADKLNNIGTSFSYTTPFSPQQDYVWLNALILVVLFAVFLWITRARFWVNFAETHKWPSRIILCVMICLFVPAANGTINWAMTPHSQVDIEQPNLITSAIKTGVYSLRIIPQLATHVPPNQRALYKCVYLASRVQALVHSDNCDLSACKRGGTALSFFTSVRNDQECEKQMVCLEDIKPASREEIFAFITQLKNGEITPRDAASSTASNAASAAEACKNVVLPK